MSPEVVLPLTITKTKIKNNTLGKKMRSRKKNKLKNYQKNSRLKLRADT
jgi:hypothetical protein